MQVRAVVPLEKARAVASSDKQALQLAARAAVGLAFDAAKLGARKLGLDDEDEDEDENGDEEEMSGFSINPFKRKRRAPPPPRGAPPDADKDPSTDDAALDSAVADSDAAQAANDGGKPMPTVNGSMGISFKKGLGTAAALGVPGAGPTLMAAKLAQDPNAGKTLAKARKGDPRAKKKIHKIRVDAKNGDPEAQHALKRLHRVNAVAQKIEHKNRSWYDAGVS